MSQLYVVLKIDGAEYVIPSEEVAQIETFTSVTRVPGTPAYVLGVTQIRQRVMPLLDLRVRFGLPRRSPSAENRIIVLNLKDRCVGLLVDSAREVLTMTPELFLAPPDVASSQTQGRGFVKSIAQLKNRILMLLDSERVIGEGVLHA